jgi:hypothetical protein
MIAFVIGNGMSREGISLEALSTHGKVFGCNAIYRDFEPYVLVSVDKGITLEISKAKIPETITHYARNPQHAKSIRLDQKKHHSRSASGPVATQLAAIEKDIKKVYLVGVDLNSPDGKVNNIYSGTENYRAKSGPAVKWHKWEKQYLEVFKQNPGIEFYRIIPMTRYIPSIWKGQRNIHHLEKDDFAKQFSLTLGTATYTKPVIPPAAPTSKPAPKPVAKPKPRAPITYDPNGAVVQFGQCQQTRYFQITFKHGEEIISQNFMKDTMYRGMIEEAREWTSEMTIKIQAAKTESEKQLAHQEIVDVIERSRAQRRRSKLQR